MERASVRAGTKVIDVAALLVWAYSREKAHLMPGRIGPAARSMDSIERVEQVGVLGGFVDTSLSHGSSVHPDAEAVHEAVTRLKGWRPGCLIEFGKTALVPDWMPDWVPPSFERVLDKKGRIKGVRDHNFHLISCDLRMVGESAEHIVHLRTVYGMWHSALVDLIAGLRQIGLVAHRVTGPAAPLEPWLATLKVA